MGRCCAVVVEPMRRVHFFFKRFCCYGRGTTKEFAFHKCGITCITPHFKGKDQTCFGVAHTVESRAIATERIPVEQANRCMRCFDGFHSQCPTNRLCLASSEGRCARGIANLKPRLNDWSQNSAHKLADEGGGDSMGTESESEDAIWS